MEYFIGAVWVGLELLCAIFFNGAFLLKKERKKYFIPFILTIWVFTSVYTNLPVNQYLKQIQLVVIFAGISWVLYEGTPAAHIILSIICYIFIAAIDGISINGMCSLLNISYESFIWKKLAYITLTTADKLIAVFLAWLMCRFRKKGDYGKQHGKWLLLSALFPTVSVLMFLMFFYHVQGNEDISISIVIFSCILMVANIAMIYIIAGIEKATMYEQDARLLKQQISLQSENYNALKKTIMCREKQRMNLSVMYKFFEICWIGESMIPQRITFEVCRQTEP